MLCAGVTVETTAHGETLCAFMNGCNSDCSQESLMKQHALTESSALFCRRREIRHLELRWPYPCHSAQHADKQQRTALSLYTALAPGHGGDSYEEIALTAITHYTASVNEPPPTHVVWL